MKRVFDEISDKEWSNHNFKPSRALPPPIESFACTSTSTSPKPPGSDSDCVEIVPNLKQHYPENLEDDDVGEAPVQVNRGRRFVVDDNEDEESGDEGLVEVIEVKSEEESDWGGFEDDDDVLEKDDILGKALQKCGKISAELRKELYGSSDDINAACKAEETGFQPILKPYQLVGVNFLLLLYRKRIAGGRTVSVLEYYWTPYLVEDQSSSQERSNYGRGLGFLINVTDPSFSFLAAILADEMGLGKTIQAITYLTLLDHLEDDPGPHLIVCPASVLENWERELRRWCPSFTVLQYHGAARSAYAKELSSTAKGGLPPPFNVILVCYSLFERHSVQQKDDRKILRRWRWSCVLMDEAHALKDKSSYRWKNLMSVARNANQRLMLTGTPLQNDLHELWSLLEFMMPDLFETGNVDLKKLLNGEDMDLISRMKSILGPFILRRLKSDVMQQLVPKKQMVEYVHMEKQQEDAYKEAIENYRIASRARIKKSSEVNSLNVVALPRRQISNYFVQFRKIANHPLLVRRIYTDEDVARFAKELHPKGVFGFECTLEKVVEELKSYNDFSIHRLLLYYGAPDMKEILSDQRVMVSGKCQALSKLLPSLYQGGHRVLIFSQWTSMLDILEWTLDVIGVSYTRLDGSTQVTERQTIVDTFNKDTSIFACLLSTRAGGQGLNLTGADTVVIHDMDFNPQIDRQAEDRCHRIGQMKPVTIYRLVTKDTVDENVYEIAKRKLVLDAAVLESGMEIDNEGDMPDNAMGEILSKLLLG
ncbi:hypothetical protein RJ640_004081 [Escallonia rubra]|uniref:Uncharacterized protein n=1 Tax=Escallonia rubra TaxID=112253 RepID=A0AA88QZD9_9ASTE|nr:hypothetical protein RJ640_004081 [Escallonia rubra]